MTYQVKIFEEQTSEVLEGKINRYLSQMSSGSEILSITYTLRGKNPKAVLIYKNQSFKEKEFFERHLQSAQHLLKRDIEECSGMKSNPFI